MRSVAAPMPTATARITRPPTRLIISGHRSVVDVGAVETDASFMLFVWSTSCARCKRSSSGIGLRSVDEEQVSLTSDADGIFPGDEARE